MLGQLRRLKVSKTEVGTPLRRLQAHSRVKAGKWVGTHLCVCKNLLPPPTPISRIRILNPMSNDVATTSQSLWFS